MDGVGLLVAFAVVVAVEVLLRRRRTRGPRDHGSDA